MTTENVQKKNVALPIAVMFMLFFMISFVTGLQNPFGVIVKNQFEASNAMSQLGNFANFLAYLLMGIPAGIILQKRGYKFTALSAVAVGFTGVLLMFFSGTLGSFPIYLVGALISGFSMCMLNTVINPMLNTLAGGGNKGNQLIQFGGTINSTGATIVPILVGYLIGGEVSKATISDANPALFLAMGIFAFAFIVLMVVNIPEPRKNVEVKKETTTTGKKYSALSFRHFVLGVVAIFCYIGIEVGIPNIMNLYMTEATANGGLGIMAGVAGSFVGAYWFLMLVGRLIGASVGAKVSSKQMVTFTAGLGIFFVLLALLLPETLSFTMFKQVVPVKILFLVLCGLCTSIMWGAIFNMAVEGLGKYTEMASGIFMTMVVGGGLFPLLQGFLADKMGFLNSFILTIALLVYLVYYALIGSKNVNKDIPVE